MVDNDGMNRNRNRLALPMRSHRTISLIMLLCVLAAGRCMAQGAGAKPAPSRFNELMDRIRNGNAYQRANAIPALASTGDEAVVGVLIDLLKDADSTVRTNAAQQLGLLTDEIIADALAGAINDPYPRVPLFAARGLAKTGTAKHAPALTKAIMDNLPEASHPQNLTISMRAMLEALGVLSAKTPPEIISLLSEIKEDEEIGQSWWWFYEAIAQCLGRIQNPAACDELKRVDKVLSSGHQDYRTWYAVGKVAGSKRPAECDKPAVADRGTAGR